MKKFLIAGCIYIWLINIFDYVSTTVLMKNGGEELNPYIGWLMEIVGVQEAMLITKIPFLLLVVLVTIQAIKTDMTNRERIVIPVCYSVIILVYSIVMYSYNFRSLIL